MQTINGSGLPFQYFARISSTFSASRVSTISRTDFGCVRCRRLLSSSEMSSAPFMGLNLIIFGPKVVNHRLGQKTVVKWRFRSPRHFHPELASCRRKKRGHFAVPPTLETNVLARAIFLAQSYKKKNQTENQQVPTSEGPGCFRARWYPRVNRFPATGRGRSPPPNRGQNGSPFELVCRK